MPAVDSPMPAHTKTERPRVNRATLDPTVAALLEAQDDTRDMIRQEIVAVRHEIGGFKQIGWALLGGFFILQVVQIVIFAQLLGVDVRTTAAAARAIVSATTSTTIGTDATGEPTTTVTTTTPAATPPPVDTEAVEAPAAALPEEH
jgi:hypothetical protein